MCRKKEAFREAGMRVLEMYADQIDPLMVRVFSLQLTFPSNSFFYIILYF